MQSGAGWLLLIFFLPIPGLILFLAIGSPRFPHWRAARFERLKPHVADVAARMRQAAPAAAEGMARDIVALADRLGRLPATSGNAVELIDDYDAAIGRLVADIDGARSHVRLLAYIFADATAAKVIDALGRAVDRGVACHVLVDPVGSHRWIKGTMRALEARGVQVRAVLPFRLWRERTRRDMRNHRKLFIVDGAIGYAGSSNVDIRSFRLKEEVSLLLLDHDAILALRRIQDAYLAASDEIALDAWRTRSGARKLVENGARLVSPLL